MISLRRTAWCGYLLACVLAASTRAAFSDEVRVRVLAEGDKPVANARLWVTRNDRGFEGKPLTAKTDANGAAVFDLPSLRKSSPLYGSVTILAPGGALDGGALKSGDNSFRLTATRTVSGRVVDEKGQPVAGARVTLIHVRVGDWDDSQEKRSFSLPDEAKAELAAKSDAQGNWRIGGVPAAAAVSVALDDERYANATAYDQAGKVSGIVLTALPGGTLEGRVVDDKGAPVANAQLYAGDMGPNPSGRSTGKTGADGTYRLTGIAPSDAVRVVVQPQPNDELVSAGLGNLSVKAGASTRAPDLVMTPGVVLSGVVTDAKTGKPIEGATVIATDSKITGSQAESGADGSYRLHVLPGQLTLFASHPDYGNAGTGAMNDRISIKVEAGAASSQNIALTPKTVFSGVAVDGDGKPLAGVKFRLGAQPWQAALVTSGADGKWSAKTEDVAPRLFSVDEWQIVSPKEPLKTSQELRVVLTATTYQTVAGRVVDENGAPLSGVKLQLNATPLERQGPTLSQEMTAVSAADGRYAFKMIAVFRPYQITAQRDGYGVVAAPDADKFQKQDNAWNVADLVMAKRDAKLVVRVLAADGVPVSGALVLAGKGDLVTAETAVDGSATLSDLSAGETLVTAVFGNASSSASGKAAIKPNEIVLTLREGAPPAPRDVKRAYEILARVLEGGKGKATGRFGDAVELMQPFNADLAATLRDKTAPPTYDAAALWNETFGNPDPESVLPRADEYVERAEERQKKVLRAFFDALQGLQIVGSDAPRAAQLLQSSETALRSMTAANRAQTMSDTVIACATTGALAARLNKPSAQGWFDFAMILIDTEYPKDDGQQDGARVWVLQGALRAGPKTFDYVASQFPVSVRASALAAEIEKPRTDSKTALALLDRIEALPDEKPRDDGNYREDKKSLFGRTVIALIPRVAKDDAALSLALARRVQSEQYKALALALAAQAQSGDARLKLLREAYELQSQWQTQGKARIAAMLYDLDPASGKPLLETLRRAVEAQQKQQQMAGSYSDWNTPPLAFYLARADVAGARRLLEVGFARTRANAQTRDGWTLQPFVLAMTALDLDRALEMSLLLDDNTYSGVQRRIAEYVLASAAQRRALSFEDWQRGNWQPRADG